MRWPTSLGSAIGLFGGWLVEGLPVPPSMNQVLLALLAGGVGGIIAHVSGALAARADSKRQDIASMIGAFKDTIEILGEQNRAAWSTVDRLREKLEVCMGRIDHLPCQENDCPLGLAGDKGKKGDH